MQGVRPASIRNRLLLRIPGPERRRIAAVLSRTEITAGQHLVEPNVAIRDAYFVESGVASILSYADGAMPMEIGMIGCFGLVGLPVVLGGRSEPYRCVVQIAGSALRLSSDDLWCAMERSAALRTILLRYAQARMTLHAQTVLCNSRHTLEQRLARWLLLALYRLDGNDIGVTHGALAAILGVRRAGVTSALADLEAAGALQRHRGHLVVCDAPTLEARSRGCHRLIQSEFDRLLSLPA
jgi:CRP-like cAMP-binding protein